MSINSGHQLTARKRAVRVQFFPFSADLLTVCVPLLCFRSLVSSWRYNCWKFRHKECENVSRTIYNKRINCVYLKFCHKIFYKVNFLLRFLLTNFISVTFLGKKEFFVGVNFCSSFKFLRLQEEYLYSTGFFTNQRIWIVLGRCLFTTRRGVLEKSFF